MGLGKGASAHLIERPAPFFGLSEEKTRMDANSTGNADGKHKLGRNKTPADEIRPGKKAERTALFFPRLT